MKNNLKETICMCIDIRNSTNFHKNFDNMKDATSAISDFITEVFKEVVSTNKKFEEKIIYAGDGIMFIYQLNPNEINNKRETLKNFLKAAEVAKNVIIKYEEQYKDENFKAGIGIDYGDCIEEHVKDIPNAKGKTPLYVGFPISRSTKICKTLPFDWRGKVRHLGLSEDFYQQLPKDLKQHFRLTNSKKKAMEYD